MCHWCTQHGDRDEKWYTTFENYLFEKVFPTQVEQEEAKKKMVATFSETEWRYTEPRYIRNRDFLIARTRAGFGSQIVTKEEMKRVLDMAFEATEREDSLVVVGHCPCRLVYEGVRDYCCIGFGMPVSMSMEVGYGRLPREGLTEFSGAEWRNLRAELRKGAKVPLKRDEVDDLIADWEKRKLWHLVMGRGRMPLIEAVCNCERRYCTYWRNREQSGVKEYCLKGHHVARIDPNLCNECGACLTMCEFGAISRSKIGANMDIGVTRCFGCGLCRTVCARQAISMVAREEIPAARSLW